MRTLHNMPTVEGFLLGNIIPALNFDSMLELEDTDAEALRIWFIDDEGPDYTTLSSWDRQLNPEWEPEPFRWRVTLYYRCSFAKTVFFETEEKYIDFLEKYEPLCYQDYEWLRAHFGECANPQPTEVL